MEHLRPFKKIMGRDNAWTKEEIKAGFEHFYNRHGHYPSSYEIDSYEFLPAAKTVQRRLKGIKNARRELGLRFDAPDHNSGKIRSKIASDIGRRNHLKEQEFLEFFKTYLPEIQVHEQKRIRPGNLLADYFIFTESNKGIIVDIFYITNIKSLGITLNIKIPKYRELPHKTCLVAVGDDSVLQQDIIDKIVKNKKIEIPRNIKVFSEKKFKEKFISGEIITTKLSFSFQSFLEQSAGET